MPRVADLQAMLVAGGSESAYAEELLWALEPDAPAFRGLKDTIEGVSARDPRLGRTLLALLAEKGWGREPDVAFALSEYNRLAAEGCELARYWIAASELELENVPGDTVETFEGLIDAGFGAAAVKLGNHLFDLGQNERAATLLTRAAASDDAFALNELGNRYCYGRGVDQDRWAALDCWMQTVDRCNVSAMTMIGRLLEGGLPDHSPDTRAAVPWFEAAASLGYADAAERAAFALWRVGPVERAVAHAEAAARSGRPNGRYLVGRMLREGRGLPQDLPRALAAFEEAAGAGWAPAMNAAADMLFAGEGVPADTDRAVAWLRKGAKARNAAAMTSLGKWMFDQPGEDGKAQGEVLLRDAAELGEPEAKERLGCILEDREGCRAEALLWLRRAADDGRDHAANRLHEMIWSERSDPEVAAELFSRFSRAAKRGNAETVNRLGLLHCEGVGTPKDEKVAFDLFLAAAQAGHVTACYNAGFCLAHGIGVRKDSSAAVEWLGKASSSGMRRASLELATCLDGGLSSGDALAAYTRAIEQSVTDVDVATVAAAMVKSRDRSITLAGGKQLERLASKGTIDALWIAAKTFTDAGTPQFGARWLRQAAGLGDLRSAHFLAISIRAGAIGADDPEEASRLLRWAADKGHEPSKEMLQARPAAPLTKDARFARLDALEGLEPVKRKLRDVAYAIELDTRRRAKGLKGGSSIPAHMAFLGNPGTGKTTVAREVGSIFKTIGRLAKGHVVEATRATLVGRHIGDTENNTREAFDRAEDGVLFIDEAYQLTSDESSRDFGPKVMGVLLTEMENRRDRVVVIVAGYTREMDAFFDSNPGLPSRIPADNRIVFPDYAPAELMRILQGLARREGYRFTPEAHQAAWRWCQGAKEAAGERFGNGRDVRDLLWAGIKAKMGRRLCTPGSRGGDLSLIVSDDVP